MVCRFQNRRGLKSARNTWLLQSIPNTYSVQSTISPDVNYAVVRYKIGNKTCVFNTNYVNGYTSGGIKVPSWNKSYTASGGATCTATITSTNISTHAWAVEFTIK